MSFLVETNICCDEKVEPIVLQAFSEGQKLVVGYVDAKQPNLFSIQSLLFKEDHDNNEIGNKTISFINPSSDNARITHVSSVSVSNLETLIFSYNSHRVSAYEWKSQKESWSLDLEYLVAQVFPNVAASQLLCTQSNNMLSLIDIASKTQLQTFQSDIRLHSNHFCAWNRFSTTMFASMFSNSQIGLYSTSINYSKPMCYFNFHQQTKLNSLSWSRKNQNEV